MKQKMILICGGAGFIGHHLAKKLMDTTKDYVVVADIKPKNEYLAEDQYCNEYQNLDLSKESSWALLDRLYGNSFNEIYQLAADMGGAGYVFTGENDLSIMTNSSLINIHCIKYAIKWKAKVFYSSSACMYPSYNQEDPSNPNCKEDSAYPANPDSEYGWEKLFSERLYLSAGRNADLDIRIARFHNIFGPEGTYEGGREKAPAAICRKVALANTGDTVEVWGPGTQTRSFLFIDECIEGISRLMQSDYKQPINIGSEEMISINSLVKMVASISGKNLYIKNITGPVGVMGRNSDNNLIKEKLDWVPIQPLVSGLAVTYKWIREKYEN